MFSSTKTGRLLPSWTGVVHPTSIFFSWIRSPQGTTTQDEGRLPLKAISKYKLSSLGLLHEINSSFPSQHHHPCYHQHSWSFLQHRCPSHRLSPFPKSVGSQGRRQPQTLCLTAPNTTMPSCPGASPSSELLSKTDSLIQETACKEIKIQFSLLALGCFGLYIFSSQVCIS